MGVSPLCHPPLFWPRFESMNTSNISLLFPVVDRSTPADLLYVQIQYSFNKIINWPPLLIRPNFNSFKYFRLNPHSMMDSNLLTSLFCRLCFHTTNIY